MTTLTQTDIVVLLVGPVVGLALGYLLGRWQAAARLNELRLAALRKQETIDALRWDMTQPVASGR